VFWQQIFNLRIFSEEIKPAGQQQDALSFLRAKNDKETT
jgi:hypothetical protein